MSLLWLHRNSCQTQCPQCGNNQLKDRGFWYRKKIEEELGKLFPGIRTARMDVILLEKKCLSKETYSCLKMSNRCISGHKMITKGLHFDNVSLVILNADNLFNYPDFRANERAFRCLFK